MSVETVRRKRSVFRWPFVLLWRGVSLISNRMGIIASLALGAAMMLVGFVLTGTLIGAVIGIPLFFLGLVLFIRGVI
ncbi:MAG: hypothetical protein SGI88_19230 [Candidatus Hydrogenedentes bacterium]|nr:hypothetical protein [Candidatus Hydrogenedentota bacterium]